jgi:hypothetical protein
MWQRLIRDLTSTRRFVRAIRLDIVLARNNPAVPLIVDFVEQHEARTLN